MSDLQPYVVPTIAAPLFLCGSPDEAEKLCIRELDAIDGTAEIALHDYYRYRLRSVIVTPSGRQWAIKTAAILHSLSCSVDELPVGANLDAPDLLALPRVPMFPFVGADMADPAKGALKVLTVAELLTMEIPKREAILHPWLLTQSLNMLHSYRGYGKTHVALGTAFAVATGGSFLTWRADRARPVLYLDGEMPAAALRDRVAALVEAHERDFDPAFLRILTPDVQDGPMPDLATAEGQMLIESVIGDAELTIVDNISTLVRCTERENDAESWREVGAWALRMRQRGRAVLFVHHDGKGGEQRGTSKREDTLDAVIQLKRPGDYAPDQGARFEIHFKKYRNAAGTDVKPIEATLTAGPNGRQLWVWRDVDDTTHDRVHALHAEGLKPGEIATELGIHKSTVSRHLRLVRSDGAPPKGTV